MRIICLLAKPINKSSIVIIRKIINIKTAIAKAKEGLSRFLYKVIISIITRIKVEKIWKVNLNKSVFMIEI